MAYPTWNTPKQPFYMQLDRMAKRNTKPVPASLSIDFSPIGKFLTNTGTYLKNVFTDILDGDGTAVPTKPTPIAKINTPDTGEAMYLNEMKRQMEEIKRLAGAPLIDSESRAELDRILTRSDLLRSQDRAHERQKEILGNALLGMREAFNRTPYTYF